MADVKKITKKDNFGAIVEILREQNRDDLVAVMEHEIELLEKKSANRKSGNSKTQKENEELKKVIILELARIGEMVTVSELQAQSELLSTTKYTNQKISALLAQLKESGEVIKTIDKKKSYFSLAV